MFANIRDYSTFNTPANLLDALAGKMTTDTVVIQQRKSKSKAKKRENTYERYEDQSNVLIAIQNDPKLLNFLKYIRKPTEPSVFMYIEGEQNLVFVVNSAMAFPVVIMKFPIEYPCIYAKSNDLCFNFPLKTINEFMTKKDKSTYQYSLILKSEDAKLMFEYRSINDNEVHTTENFTQIDKQIMLDTVFFGKIQNNPLFESDIGDKIHYVDMFDSMAVLMVAESKDFSQTDKFKYLDRAQQQLIIEENDISIDIRINKISNVIKLVDRNNISNNLLYWDSKLLPMTMNMIKYDSMFKSGEKLVDKTDFVYNVICEWKQYPGCMTYMFIKIITNIRVKDILSGILNNTMGSLPTFNEIFNSGPRLIEMYLAHSV